MSETSIAATVLIKFYVNGIFSHNELVYRTVWCRSGSETYFMRVQNKRHHVMKTSLENHFLTRWEGATLPCRGKSRA